MKMWSVLCVALCVMMGMVACSNPGSDVAAPKDEVAAPAAPEAAPVTEPAATEPAPAAEPAATEPAPAADAAAPAADAAAPAGDPAALIGTTWTIGEYTAAFKDGGVVNVKGGQMPDGIDGTYTVENGKVKINVLTATKEGTWDGTNLVIDGTPAAKQ